MEEMNLKFDRLMQSLEKMQELNNSQSRMIEVVSELAIKNQKGLDTNTESIKLLTEMVGQNNEAINDILSHIKTLYSSLS